MSRCSAVALAASVTGLEHDLPLRSGDLDVLLESRAVRVLVPYSRTLFFNDRGAQRGLTADTLNDFESSSTRNTRTKGKADHGGRAADDAIAGCRPGRGPRRHRRGQPHHHRRAREERRFLRSADRARHRRDRGHRSALAEARGPRGSRRPRSARAPLEQLLSRASRRSTRGCAPLASRNARHRPAAEGRGPDGHGGRGPDPAHRGGRVEGGTPGRRYKRSAPAARARADRRRERRLGAARRHAEAARGGEEFIATHPGSREKRFRSYPQYLVALQNATADATGSASRHGAAVPQVRAALQLDRDDGRARLPGIAPRPGRAQPGGRDRHHAAPARDRRRDEGRRHHAGRGQRARRHQVPAPADRPLHHGRGARRAEPHAAGARLLQRRARGAWPRCAPRRRS